MQLIVNIDKIYFYKYFKVFVGKLPIRVQIPFPAP